jgi:peptidyl-prolyl cis-trans isomerase C
MQKAAIEANAAAMGYRLLRIATDQYGVLPTEMDPQQQKQAENIAAKELVLEQAVLASPEAREVVVPQSEVRNAVAQIRERYDSEEAFEDTLASNQLSLDALEVALSRELRVEAVLTYISSKVAEVDDTEARLFYYMHRERFFQPETRTARHIMITVNPDFPENTREAVVERLELIKTRVTKNPGRFEDQALQFSECPTSLHGGLLGQVKPGVLYPELEKELFAMKPGAISDIIESPVGLHIIRCEEIAPAATASFDEVKAKLRENLTERKRKKHQREWLRAALSSHTESHQEG